MEMEGEPIPLIPEISSISCPDTSHILREEFQDILGKEKISKKISENLATFKSDELFLKASGLQAVKNFAEAAKHDEEIRHAEKTLLQSQIQFAKTESINDGDKFKLQKIYPDIDEDVVNKYHLIKIDDIVPHITERILNEKMPPFDFISKKLCSATSNKFKKLKRLECTGLQEKDKGRYISRHIRNSLFPPQKQKQAKKARRISHKDNIVFIADPEEVIFSDFEVDKVYVKKLVLKNISSCSQYFKMPLFRPDSPFSLKLISKSEKLAAGMCAKFIITFITKELLNYKDELIFVIKGSQPVTVSVVAYRTAPFIMCLVYSNDENIFEDFQQSDKDYVYNYTIDCGGVMIGSTKQIKLILQNCGGDGSFFLLSEEDWICGTINDITEDYRLLLPEFSLYPAYFILKHEELNEITIEFTPSATGLCLDKFFILCDTNCFEEIDIIGDCIEFEPDFIKFNMPDCPLTAIDSINAIRNVLHLGASYKNQVICGTFYLFNTSSMSYNFEWRNDDTFLDKNYCQFIESDWININPKDGILESLIELEFTVTVHMKSSKYGLHKHVFSLYINDILEKSLKENYTFTFDKEYKNDLNENLLTIEFDQIEIQLHHIPLKLEFIPDELFFPNLKYKKESCIQILTIINKGFCCLLCKWLKNTENKNTEIVICPDYFEIEPDKSIKCSIFIVPLVYKDVDETITLSIDKEQYKKHIKLFGFIDSPTIHVSKSLIVFGQVLYNNLITAPITLQNPNDTSLSWCAMEYSYNFQERVFQQDYGSLSANCGNLCHKGSECYLEYMLDTSVPREVIKLLIFYTIFGSNLCESASLIIIANVIQPIVRLLNDKYEEEIFSSSDEYFVHETITKTFYIHNESNIEVKYYWADVSGDHKDNVSISFEYLSGKLYPYSRKLVTVTLELLTVGQVFDLYVPCYIESVETPCFLQICCNIRPPQVIFTLPLFENGRYVNVTWPTYDSIIIDEVLPTPEGEYEDYNYEECVLKSSKIINIIDEASADLDTTTSWFPSDIYSYLRDIEQEGEYSFHYPSETSSSSGQEKRTLSEKSTAHANLMSVFGSNSSICEYIIEFTNVKCGKVAKKTIDITNIMDVPLNISISVKNFKNKPLNQKVLQRVLINLKWKQDTTYSEQLSEHGIVVFAKPAISNLENKSTTMIEIIVYAETWGYYLEEIAIEVGDMPVFYINLAIHIYGLPIDLPAAYNFADYSSHLINFGSMPTCTTKQKRLIFVRNISNIPCTITWHAYHKDNDDVKLPFSLLLDVFGIDKDSSTGLVLKLTNYNGRPCSSKYPLFEVEPREIYIQPNERKSCVVYFDPTKFINNYDVINFHGILVGHVYIEEKYCNVSNIVIRNPISDLKNIMVSLSANVSTPELNLNCIQGETDVNISLGDWQYDQIEEDIYLLFRNTSKFTIAARFNCDYPFQIVHVRSLTNDCTISNHDYMYSAAVFADNCVEVKIKCILSKYLVNGLAGLIYKNELHYLDDILILDKNKLKITKSLHIMQECQIHQELSISVTLMFPLISLSTYYLDFGTVCLGSQKQLTVKIRNRNSCRTWFKPFVIRGSTYFLEPCSEYLEPTQIHEYSLILTICFRPTNIKVHRDEIKIVTRFPQYQLSIELKGCGTYDEKYYCENIPDKII